MAEDQSSKSLGDEPPLSIKESLFHKMIEESDLGLYVNLLIN